MPTDKRVSGLGPRGVICASLLALLLAWPAAPPAATPLAQTDAQRAELQGPVRDVATRFRGDGDDPDGRPVGAAHYDRQGWLTEDEQVTPDFVKKRAPRRVDRTTTVFTSTMGASTERFAFDANGDVTQTELWYSDHATGPPDQITRAAYDGRHRRVVERFVDADGTVRGVTSYKRDAAGNVVHEDEWLNDPAGPHAVSTYAYKFDAHGNWIERTQKRTGVSDDGSDYGHVGTLIRAITYYDR
jgi:hypothetical protein